MKTPCRRPRIWSGVADCRIVWRNTELIASEPPAMARKSIASTRATTSTSAGRPGPTTTSTTPKAATEAPNARMEPVMIRPCQRSATSPPAP